MAAMLLDLRCIATVLQDGVVRAELATIVNEQQPLRNVKGVEAALLLHAPVERRPPPSETIGLVDNSPLIDLLPMTVSACW
jgi:hypothetical protein